MNNAVASDPITIIGGGIGGLFSAVALQARGLSCRVYEAADKVKPVGAGLLLAANALAVFARASPALLADVYARGQNLAELNKPTFDIVDAGGQTLLGGFDVARLQHEFGHGLIAIKRGELHTALLAALPAGTLITGKRLTSLSQHAARVHIGFADGGQIESGLLIAADGAKSVARRHLFPDVALRYSGQTSYRGMARMNWRELGDLPAAEMWGDWLRFGFTPVGGRQVYWFATLPAQMGQPHAPPVEAMAQIARRSLNMHPNVARLLDATEPENVLQTDILDMPALPAWHRGRVVLLGDAAHATTPNLGQGACQAIEDGYVLAQQLATSADLPQACVAYTRIRKPKADWVVRTARRLGGIVHVRNPLLRGLRNAALRAMPAVATTRQAERVYRLNY